MSDKWDSRVKVVDAGLEELAARELHALRDKLDSFVNSDGVFDPQLVVANPASLRQSLKQFQRFLKVKDRTPVYLRIMLALGPVLTVCCVFLLMFGTAIVFEWAGFEVKRYQQHQDIVYRISLIGFLFVFVVAAFSYAGYITSVHLIGNAEVLSKRLRSG